MIRQVASSIPKGYKFLPHEQTRVDTTPLDAMTVRWLRPNAILLRRKRRPVSRKARASLKDLSS
jgi:hypothetical protein